MVMAKYNKPAVDRAIKNAGADVAEARQIHRLLSGRHETVPEPQPLAKKSASRPGGKLGRRAKPAMSKERFLGGIAALGHNINTANQLLGIGRSTIYRMASGQAAVPPVIARLMDMYERHGIPPEHQP
jgi:hypothetical protein